MSNKARFFFNRLEKKEIFNTAVFFCVYYVMITPTFYDMNSMIRFVLKREHLGGDPF